MSAMAARRRSGWGKARRLGRWCLRGATPPAVPGPRIRALLDAYGLQDRDGFVFRIVEYQASMISAIAATAAGGDGRYGLWCIAGVVIPTTPLPLWRGS
jgi:hypothetical protein